MLRMSDFGQRVCIAIMFDNSGRDSADAQKVLRTEALSAIGSRVVAGAPRKFQESGLRVAPLKPTEGVAMGYIRAWANRAVSVLPYAIASATIIAILLFA
jgi:hypothetical protein